MPITRLVSLVPTLLCTCYFCRDKLARVLLHGSKLLDGFDAVLSCISKLCQEVCYASSGCIHTQACMLNCCPATLGNHSNSTAQHSHLSYSKHNGCSTACADALQELLGETCLLLLHAVPFCFCSVLPGPPVLQ